MDHQLKDKEHKIMLKKEKLLNIDEKYKKEQRHLQVEMIKKKVIKQCFLQYFLRLWRRVGGWFSHY